MQKELKVKIKKVREGAVIPKYAKHGDAGLDLTAAYVEADAENDNIVYHTGIAIEIPEGYVGLVFPRSSNSKTELYLTNSVGVIDSGYRGEILLKYKFRDKNRKDVKCYLPGDRVGQLIIIEYPKVSFEEVETLSDSERGNGGYGSTGN